MGLKKIKKLTGLVILLGLIGYFIISCEKTTQKVVVIYTSVDQIFSEPILHDFEQKTGIKIKAVYDVEASKTTGLVNRLLAEKSNPSCDVFWNSEVARTILLKQKGALAPYISPSSPDIPNQFKDKEGYWAGFAARARILIYNTNMLHKTELPESIFELTKPEWKGRVAMAYPLFGTTATHIAGLYGKLGKEKTEAFLKELKTNGIIIVDGNSVTRDMVAEGKVPIAFTDTDDAHVAIQAKKPVGVLYPDQDTFGTLLIPNTVALIHDCPHPEEGKRFIDYLLSKEVESKLAFSESAQMPLRDKVQKPAYGTSISSIKAMEVDFYEVCENLNESTRFCQKLFIR